MRQICCHPALVGAPARSPSGKFDALWELLEPLLAEGHKVLLFSQFVECLTLVGREMKERGIPHHVLTGKTNERDREAVVQRFSDDAEAERVPGLAQGRRHGAQPDRGQLRGAVRSVVEPGGRGAGHRPHAPHRADAQGDRPTAC